MNVGTTLNNPAIKARRAGYIQGYSDALQDVEYMATTLGMPPEKIVTIMQEFREKRLKAYEDSTDAREVVDGPPRLILRPTPSSE